MRRRTVILLLCLLWPAFTGAQNLSLEECLTYCENGSRDIRNASLGVESARYQLQEARWEYFPRVSVTGLAYHALHPMLRITLRNVLGNSDAANVLHEQISIYAGENGMKTYVESLKRGFGSTLMLTQPLYAGGRIVNGNRLASLGVEAARLQADIATRDVRDSVENKYWTVVALQEKRLILNETLALLAMLEKDLSSALSAGLATEADLLQIQLKRSEVEALSRRLNGGLSLAKMDLLDVIGYPYNYKALSGIVLTDRLGEAPLPENILLEDPDMRLTEESRLLDMQVEAKQLEKKMAVGELLPQVAVGATYGYNALFSLGGKTLNGLVFATVQIPLTDIGKAAARSRRYEAQVQMARNDRDFLNSRLRLLEQKLRLELFTAWDELQVRDQAVSNAQNALEHMESRYKAGQVTASVLAQASLEVSSAREQLVSARIAYRKAVNAYQAHTVAQ